MNYEWPKRPGTRWLKTGRFKTCNERESSGQENRDSVHNQWLEKSLIIRRGEVVIDGCEARKRGNGLF